MLMFVDAHRMLIMREGTVGVFGLELLAWGCRYESQGIVVEESLYLV